MTEIREGRPDDLPRLREIQSGAVAEPSPQLLDTAADGPLRVLVIVEADPLGYAIVVTDGDAVAYVPELAVAPDRQGQGYGSRLLTHLAEDLHAAGYDELRLTARVDDEQVRAFYEGHGFESQRRLPDFFEAGDGQLYVRALDG